MQGSTLAAADRVAAVGDVCDDYNRMFEALSCAIEVCMDGGVSLDLLADGVAILVARRSERETETRANWRLVGRG